MSNERFQNYACLYPHQGEMWEVVVKATSREDAQKRLYQMAFGTVLGTDEGRVPAFPGAGLWIRFKCWLANGAQP